MFALDHTIDAVQNAKKTAVDHFVTNEDLKKSLKEIVEAETAFSKAISKFSVESATKVGDEITRQTKNVVEQFQKIDWVKSNPFFSEVTKWTSYSTPAAKAGKNA